MAENDGGQAFPSGPETEVTHSEFGPSEYPTGNRPGMSLRDWFAGQADEVWDIYMWLYGDEDKDDLEGIAKSIAKIRGLIADAMLKEREK